MAKLTISEYATKGRGKDGVPMEMPQEPRLRDQVVDFTSGMALSTSFLPATTYIRIATDTTCSFVIGASPTATANNAPLFAGTSELFAVIPGHRLAVIANG